MSEQVVKSQIRVGDRVAIETLAADGSDWYQGWKEGVVEWIGQDGSIAVDSLAWCLQWDGQNHSAANDVLKWVLYKWTPAIEQAIRVQKARYQLKEMKLSELTDEQAIALYEYAKGLGVL